MIGMHEHLHVLVLAQVVIGVLIDGLHFLRTQVLHHHVERLLIILHELWL